MGTRSTRRLEPLARWSPALFLAGGGLVVGHAAVNGVEAFTTNTPPPDVFGPAGYLLAVVGLLGLYPALVERTPRLARAAATVAAVPLAGWVVVLTVTLGEFAGVVAPVSASLPGWFLAVHLATLLLVYVLFGVAGLRSGGHLRTVGGLLLVAPALWVAMLAGAALLGNGAVGPFLVGAGQALVHLGVGATLRAARLDEETPAGDPTPG
jgi:hypothetical protein